MPVEGTCKLSRVQVVQFSLDFSKSTPEIKTLVALIDPETGTAAFMRQSGTVWSAETQAALRAFVDCLEQDAARSVMHGVGVTSPSTTHQRAPDGLGEHLTGEIDDM